MAHANTTSPDVHPQPQRTTPRRAAMLIAGGLGIALASGCMRDANSRLTIGHEAEGNGIVALQAVYDGPVLTEVGEPSVTGLDRTHWTRRTVLVPNDGVQTYPHLTRLAPRFDESTARARAEFPTELSSLETGGDVCAEVGEALLWPAWVIGDLVMAIPRALRAPSYAPTDGYQRSAAQREVTLEAPMQEPLPMEVEAERTGA